MVRELLQPVQRYLKQLQMLLTSGWSRFWFTPADPTTLATIRIGTGLLLLYAYGSLAGHMLEFIGPDAWIDATAILRLRGSPASGGSGEEYPLGRWWSQSIWFYVQRPAVAKLLYGYFLGAIVCFSVGLFSRVSNVLVWVGHLSFIHRSYAAWFGMDSILAMMLLYLMIAPCGATLSVDRRLQHLWRRDGAAPAAHSRRSWTATLAIRLIQVHICLIYLCSGLSKLQGESWWDGTAIWNAAMVTAELSVIDLHGLAQFDPWVVHLVSGSAVAATLAFEISFAFLVWNRQLRPLLLIAAVLLHSGIWLFMGLGGFSAAMLIGCLAFVPPKSMRWFLDVLLRRNSQERDLPADRGPGTTPTLQRGADGREAQTSSQCEGNVTPSNWSQSYSDWR